MLGWATRLNLRAAHAPRACRVTCYPKGPKLGFEHLPTYKTLHCVGTACTAFLQPPHRPRALPPCPCKGQVQENGENKGSQSSNNGVFARNTEA